PDETAEHQLRRGNRRVHQEPDERHEPVLERRAGGEYASRGNPYIPPVCGNAEASSQQIKAPKSVSTPPAVHASMIGSGDRRGGAISDGWTRIDAPMIVPATIAIAWRRDSERGRSGTETRIA